MDGHRMTFLDVETTGPSIIKDHIISLGVAILFPDGSVATSVELFGGGTSSTRALEVHKISDYERQYKRWFEDAASTYAKMFDKSILVGHNAKAFDIPLIWGAMKRAKVQFEATAVLDTLKMARKIELDKAAGDGKLGSLCTYLKIPYGNHDALGDALSSMALFTTMVRHMENPTLEKVKLLCS